VLIGGDRTYQAAGRTAEVIAMYEQNLAACERVLGPDDPVTLASRDRLETAYRAAETENPNSQPSDP
jgi:hypothetical protein